MKKPGFSFLLLFLLLVCVVSLERKRKEATEMTCSVSATGEKVCTSDNGKQLEGGIDDDGEEDDEYDDGEDDDEYDDGEDDDDDDDCVDMHENCSMWADRGECEKNPGYMLKSCQKSCNTCSFSYNDSTEKQMAEKEFLLDEVAKYGHAQEPGDEKGATFHKTMFQVRKTVDYMKNFIYVEHPTHELSAEILAACTNNHELCSFWASIGECDNNPSFMVTKCAPACLSCHKIDYNSRCGPRDPDAQPGLKPGEMNLMFQRIVNTAPGNATEAAQLAAAERKLQDDGTPIYTVTVHSRPETDTPIPDDDGVIAFDESKDKEEAPWVITLDNFLTEEECQHLINLGHKNGYKRSTDVGEIQTDGSFSQKIGNGRTSENTWCDLKSGCRQDPLVQRVLQRLASVTGIPSDNDEDLQMLRYEPNQYYRAHHDYIPHQRDRHSGPRILTFFLYLSDVEEGGGTRLNNLGIDIQPKVGRALLWPSSMSYNPLDIDERTRHEALPVIKGTKFAANAWIHLFDNVTPQKLGCT